LFSVVTVPAMPEQMQQRTQEQQHIRQNAEGVRPMLRQKKKGGNGEKPEQRQA
jgi:hypothetical protein